MITDNNDLESVLRQWFPLDVWELSSGPSGMNNTTHYVEVNGAFYVLRIYETHRDEIKVRYEHAVLLGLAELALPFSTPVPVMAPSGETYLRLEEGEGREAGKFAALFHFIAGIRPELREVGQIYSFGRATAQLANAIQQLELSFEPEYPCYYELGLAGNQDRLSEVIRFCNEPTEPFLKHTEPLRRIGEMLNEFAKEAPSLRKLPHQLIHGDLNASNSLVGGDNGITALLDFEFTTRDLRVMEVAVCLSELILQEVDTPLQAARDKIEAFLSGYGSVIKLTPDEVKVLQTLIQLRRLDVFVHFLSRFRDGIDTSEVMVEMITSAIAVDNWLQANGELLVAVSEKQLLEY